MSTVLVSRWVVAALLPALLVGPALGGEPSVNQLEGTVEFADGGQPAAGVPVGMMHRTKGYLAFDRDGLMTYGQNEYVFGIYPKRNGKYACQTVTDEAGHFVLRDFGAPGDTWVIAAGDAKHGYALQVGFKPEDFQSQPLRLKLEKPAYIKINAPEPPKGMQVYTGVCVATPPALADEGASATGDEDDLSERVVFRSAAMSDDADGKPKPVGPLPAGQCYKVVSQATGNNLAYAAVLFERVVEAAPGETAEVTLAPKEGLTVTGCVTGTDDKPLAKVNVQVRAEDGTVVGGVSDKDGKYELHGVPAGTHILRLLRHARRTTPG